MTAMKRVRQRALGGALVLSIVGLGIGQVVLQNKAEAQRAEAQGYVLSATDGESLIRGGGSILIKVDPSRGSNSVALSSSTAAAVVHLNKADLRGKVNVHAEGGMTEIEWRNDDEMLIKGRADLVCEGDYFNA